MSSQRSPPQNLGNDLPVESTQASGQTGSLIDRSPGAYQGLPDPRMTVHNLTVSGKGHEVYRSAFVLALRRIAEEASERDPDAPELLACAPLGAGGAVVLYREQPAGPVLGKRYDVQAFAALFSLELTAEDLAEVAYSNELADPTGSGEVLDVDWADGLGFERSQVQWVGAGEWLRA